MRLGSGKVDVKFLLILILLPAVYALECDNWQTAHPEWLWCDDFETEQDLSVNYHDFSTNNFAASTDDTFEGQYSLKQHYDTGQVDAGWISWFYCDTLGNDYGNCQDEIYMRWYHKFEDGFQGFPPKMARITNIGPGWNKRFGVYYWIDDEYEHCIAADVRAYDGWIPIIRTDFKYDNPANVGRWVCHEMRVQQGTSGGYTFWADDVMIAERNGVNLNGGYNFNNAMLDTYWNGGSPVAQNRYYDNFVISTERIGCVQSGDICDSDNIRCVGTGKEYTTIQSAINVAVAGDEIIVYDGTYSEDVSIDVSGTSTNKITIHSDIEHGAIVKSFDVSGDYIIVEDFRIENPSDANCFNIDGDNNEILGNHLDQCKRYGVWVTGDNNLLQDNYLYKPQIGFTILGNNNIIDSNEVDGLHDYGVLGDADYSRFFGSDHIFRNNLFHNMERAEVGDAHVDCWQTFDVNGNSANNILVFNNTCHDFSQGFMGEGGSVGQSGGITFDHNVFAHGGAWGIDSIHIADVIVSHNTFYDIYWYGVGLRNTFSTNGIIKSNIFHGGPDGMNARSYMISEGATGSGDYNLIFQADDPQDIGPNDIMGQDPMFANIANDDYHLLYGSPACTGGEGGTYIGAFPCDGYVPPDCVHPANTDGDSVISNSELVTYIADWKTGSVSLMEVMDAIAKWKTGC